MIRFPSPEFDDAVAAVCHGTASDEQARALNGLLRHDSAARDEYILRVELHSRLASDPDLFVSAEAGGSLSEFPLGDSRRPAKRRRLWPIAVAASLALVAAVAWYLDFEDAGSPAVATSRAVAMLSETAGARWGNPAESLQLGAPLEPGWLKLESGLAQVVFYSGARIVIEGPAELRLVSASQAVCRVGRLTAEIPSQAQGFRIDTPHGQVSDRGATFGLHVGERRTAIHVFKGEASLRPAGSFSDEYLQEGAGVVVEAAQAPRRIPASRAAFASLFDLQARSLAAEALRLRQWRAAGVSLNGDPSLLVRFDFEDVGQTGWQLRNLSDQSAATGDATVVGCQWGEGRWPGKRALEFQSVSDRVRLNAPGEFDAVTAAAWVRIQGLDRKLNSLFMCDGFAAGSLHWLIRNDGVLGLTIVGERPGDFQIATSPAALTLDRFGIWTHLAVVVDGRSGQVSHYVDGRLAGENSLRIKPPYRVGAAEVGNWNAKGFPEDDPFMIRNFSGAMDEFCLFGRALEPREIEALYAAGRPEMEAVAQRD